MLTEKGEEGKGKGKVGREKEVEGRGEGGGRSKKGEVNATNTNDSQKEREGGRGRESIGQAAGEERRRPVWDIFPSPSLNGESGEVRKAEAKKVLVKGRRGGGGNRGGRGERSKREAAADKLMYCSADPKRLQEVMGVGRKREEEGGGREKGGREKGGREEEGAIRRREQKQSMEEGEGVPRQQPTEVDIYAEIEEEMKKLAVQDDVTMSQSEGTHSQSERDGESDAESFGEASPRPMDVEEGWVERGREERGRGEGGPAVNVSTPVVVSPVMVSVQHIVPPSPSPSTIPSSHTHTLSPYQSPPPSPPLSSSLSFSPSPSQSPSLSPSTPSSSSSTPRLTSLSSSSLSEEDRCHVIALMREGKREEAKVYLLSKVSEREEKAPHLHSGERGGRMADEGAGDVGRHLSGTPVGEWTEKGEDGREEKASVFDAPRPFTGYHPHSDMSDMSEWAERRKEARRHAEEQFRLKRKEKQQLEGHRIMSPQQEGAEGGSLNASWKDATFREEGERREVEIQFPDGSRFMGDCVPHAPSLIGSGRYYFANGDVYVGRLLDGKMEGNGSLLYVNGDRYEGSFRNGDRHGIGRYTSVCGDEYFGEYQNGNRHGRGVFRSSRGDTYEGAFENGKMSGKGKLVRSDGSEYDGDFMGSKYWGKGTLRK